MFSPSTPPLLLRAPARTTRTLFSRFRGFLRAASGDSISSTTAGTSRACSLLPFLGIFVFLTCPGSWRPVFFPIYQRSFVFFGQAGDDALEVEARLGK